MNGKEALEALRIGKKIKLHFWKKDEYLIYRNSQFILMPRNEPYDFLYIMHHTNPVWNIYDDRPTYNELKFGDKFRWTENGPIMQKVYIAYAMPYKDGYLNTSTFNCGTIDTINGNNKVYKV